MKTGFTTEDRINEVSDKPVSDTTGVTAFGSKTGDINFAMTTDNWEDLLANKHPTVNHERKDELRDNIQKRRMISPGIQT